MEGLLPVTQDDREAAAALQHDYTARRMRAGELDDSPFVQAFARHRVAAWNQRAPIEEGAVVVPTDEMRATGREYLRSVAFSGVSWEEAACGCWSAMIAASPDTAAVAEKAA